MSFTSPKFWLFTGALLGALAVASGAFGAHGLEIRLAKDGSLSTADQRLLDVWETAARYQMYHALALLAVGFVAARYPLGATAGLPSSAPHRSPRAIPAAGVAFTLGTLVFSGCLYALVLTGHRWLGAIVPIGGTLLIAGWICLAVASCRAPS